VSAMLLMTALCQMYVSTCANDMDICLILAYAD